MNTVKDLRGQRFGSLTAIDSTRLRSGTSVVWRCKCDCGNEVLVSAGNLVGGRVKSCGCICKFVNLTGHRFGKLTVVEPTDQRRYRSVVWRCKCDCGNEKLVASSSLLSGDTKSCGCLRGKGK